MKLLRSFQLCAFGLVLLSIVGLCIAQRSVGLLLVAGALATLSWYVTEGPRGRHLPKWVSTLLVTAAGANPYPVRRGRTDNQKCARRSMTAGQASSRV